MYFLYKSILTRIMELFNLKIFLFVLASISLFSLLQPPIESAGYSRTSTKNAENSVENSKTNAKP